MSAFSTIEVGSRVTITVPAGRNLDGTVDTKAVTGRAVMRGPAGWVINIGGAHGTPKVATPENLVRVGGRRAR